MFSIDLQSRVPIYEQLVNQVERFIVSGILKVNEQLPSVRQIAFELGINPNTIQRAYTELERMGVIVSIVGKGSFVTNDIYPIVDKKKEFIIDEMRTNVDMLKKLGLNNKEIQSRIFRD